MCRLNPIVKLCCLRLFSVVERSWNHQHVFPAAAAQTQAQTQTQTQTTAKQQKLQSVVVDQFPLIKANVNPFSLPKLQDEDVDCVDGQRVCCAHPECTG